MIIIKKKALSVNRVWQGRRFKTPIYKQYEQEIFQELKKQKKLILPDSRLTLAVDFGLSSSTQDIDNGIKPLLDILTKFYQFNDNRVYNLFVNKHLTKKGHEQMAIKIYKHMPSHWDLVWGLGDEES